MSLASLFLLLVSVVAAFSGIGLISRLIGALCSRTGSRREMTHYEKLRSVEPGPYAP